MKTLKVALALLAASALGAVAFGTHTNVAAQGGGPVVNIANVPLPVTGTVGHLGQSPSLIVNLRFANNQPARRINPATGSMESNPFVVPSGFVFVLTDIHASAVCTPGQGVLYLLFQNSGSNVLRERQSSVCNINGEGNNDRHLTTGLIFAAGSHIETALSPTVDHFAWGEGYLVPVE